MTDESRTILPLKEAYKFGIDHGYPDEMEKIRSMEIEWDLSYTSTLRRGYVIDLFQKHGIFDEFKNKCWPTGNTPFGESKIRFALKVRQRYEDFLQTGNQPAAAEESEEAAEQAFAAESDLRDFLAKNPECIEKGMRIYGDAGKVGTEFSIDDGKGRIDLLAVDAKGGFVVIELKLGQGRNKTLGQLLYYMGWVDQHMKAPCRGIIIAKEIPEDLRLAAKRVPGVSLYRYSLSVSISPIAN